MSKIFPYNRSFSKLANGLSTKYIVGRRNTQRAQRYWLVGMTVTGGRQHEFVNYWQDPWSDGRLTSEITAFAFANCILSNYDFDLRMINRSVLRHTPLYLQFPVSFSTFVCSLYIKRQKHPQKYFKKRVNAEYSQSVFCFIFIMVPTVGTYQWKKTLTYSQCWCLTPVSNSDTSHS